jgi:SH3 domain-containing protein
MAADVQILEILLIYRRDAPDIRTSSAQTAMVRRTVNLRSGPSTNVKPIALLTPPAQLTLVEPNQQNAFYHVRTSDGKEGWVWAKNITLNPPAPTRLGPPEIYPDSAKTPGFANPDVTQDNIAENLCNPTWSTSTIRPPTSYTNPLKQNQMQQYSDTLSDPNAACMLSSNNKSCYEEDHLISLENSGHPWDPRNLWPEPYNTQIDGQTIGARQKDTVENYIHNAICFNVPGHKSHGRQRIPR